MLTVETRQRMIQMESTEAATLNEVSISTKTNSNEKVTYAAMLDTCKELISTVQNDQSQMKSVLESITDWTEQLRRHKEVAVTFHSNSIPLHVDDVTTSSQKHPYASVTKAAHYTKQNKRLKSANEYYSTKQMVATPVVNMLCDDAVFTSSY